MAKDTVADSIMAAGKMKPLLTLSKKEPVQAAFALSKDGDGLILLDKKAKPRKVAALLRAAAKKAKIELNTATVRFGRAEVDTEYDPGMVRFFVNKDAPGMMRVKLMENVKRASFQKVEINVDESLDAEPEEDGADDAPQEAEAGGEQADTGPDVETLRRELMALIGRIGAASGDDARRKAQLAGLAQAAGAACKGTDAEAASRAVAALREALESQPAASPAPGAGPGAGGDAFRAAWRKSWDEWLAAMDAVDGQLDMFAHALRAEGDPGMDEVAAALPGLFEGHKMKLNGIGLRLGGVGDAGLAKLVGEARGVIDGFSNMLGQNPRIAAIDAADLGVAMSIGGTLSPALRRLAAALPEDQALPRAA